MYATFWAGKLRYLNVHNKTLKQIYDKYNMKIDTAFK
jgi:hypothetical protein